VGGDAPFTNISVNSKAVYDDIFKHYVFPDGKTIDDLWPTILRIQVIIVEFMSKGRPDGLPYRFPILTANFKADKKEGETKWFKYVAEANAKGMMNVNFAAKFSMCCRLSLDFDFKQNSFGGGGVKVGSARVGNINLPRLAYKAKHSIESFKLLLRETITADMEFLHAYWKLFEELIDVGYLKFFRDPTHWFDKSMFFLTVGFCGIWDAVEILIPEDKEVLRISQIARDFIPKESIVFDKRIALMREILDIFNEMTRAKSNGVKFNVEEVPSEGAAGTMAKFNMDFGETKLYYSNQFIPLQMEMPLHQRIKIEAEMQSRLTGGGMTFLNFDAPLSAEQAYQIHAYMLEMGFNGQFCINYGYTKCNACEKVENGIKQSCSCGSTSVKNYTRVVGYLAEIHSSAKSKEAEILDRKTYDSSVSI
jgi:anaerobic ribonucleoside-triphosphate reductase